ncbi:MAG: chromosome segregation SMC family protein [Candidatus Nitrosocaldus sp.]|nr:chromosome segregation SMC family protein [Candidatus Nitrosocaldus sp.]
MVYIKRVEIYGFKSFARRSTVLNLDRGLVCITGPNGSGKSNILDAIAFALGENSVRSLRVDRLQSLIHDNGRGAMDGRSGEEGEGEDGLSAESKGDAGGDSSNSSRKRRAVKVSITFDNSDRGIPVDSNTVTIAREMYDNGENQYYLNGKHVNKSTITNLLDVVLATPSKLNIVQQGMVMRIAELNPEERRRIIEEIIGLAYFDEKKEEAMKQLAEADRRLEVALARMDEVRGRIDELEQERNDQLRLEFLAREIERLRGIRLRGMLKRTRERITALEQMIEEKRGEVEGISRSMEELRARITALEDERGRFMRQVEESSRAKAEISRQLSGMIVRVEQLKAMINANQGRIVSIGRSIPMLMRERDGLLGRVKAVEQDVKALACTLDRLMGERRGVEEELSRVNGKIGALLNRYTSAREEEKGVEAEMRRMLDGASSIELKIASIGERIKVSSESMAMMERRSAEMLEEISRLRMLLSRLSSKRAEYAQGLEALNDSIAKAHARRDRLLRQVESATAILERAEYIATRYRAEVDAAMQGEDGAIARLIEGADRLGIVGVLQGIVSWDARYSRAVMAVGSNWLKALIVRDTASMMDVLEQAKGLGLARVTVIPLDMVEGCEEIESLRLRRRVGKGKSRRRAGGGSGSGGSGGSDDASAGDGTSEYMVHPLSHFITSGYRGLVNFVFGDTLLAYSRDDALSLAERGYRAVTIDGELFEPRVRAATIEINTKVSDIIRLVARSRSVDELRDALSLLKEMIVRRREEVKGIEASIRDMEEGRREIITNIARIDAEIEQANGTLARYEQMVRESTERIGRLRDEIQGMQGQMNALTSERAVVEEKISTLRERMSALSRDREDLERALEEANKMKASMASRLEHLDREIRSVMAGISSKNSERDGMSRRIDEIVREIEGAKAEARESAGVVKRCRDELNGLTEELRAMRDREQEVIDASSSSLTRLQRYDEELRSLSSEEKRLSRQLSTLERELALYSKEQSDLRSREESLMREIAVSESSHGHGVDGEHENGHYDSIDTILGELEEEYNMLKSNVNQLANRSYMQLIDGYRGMSEKKNQLEEERNAIVRFIEQIEGEKRQLFSDAFSRVDREVRSIFTTMTDGAGSAWLEIDDDGGREDILSSGITFMVQFPSKPARESNSLSGGEKTIAAITFLLALQSLKPAPFYLFDEIDAHLDSVNTERLGRIVRERADRGQIIMVTLKDALVAAADMIYGVYARDGVSQVVRYRIPIAR